MESFRVLLALADFCNDDAILVIAELYFYILETRRNLLAETTPPPITADPALRRDFTKKDAGL